MRNRTFRRAARRKSRAPGIIHRALRWRPSRGEARALIFVVAVKSVVTLAMLLFAWNYAGLADAFGLHAYFPDALNTKHRWYTGSDTASWYLPLANWDGQHYLLLSDYGYNHGYDRTSGQQFYPLYPLLIRIFSVVLPRPLSAMLLNYVFMAGLALFLYRICVACRCRWPLLSVLVVMAFPTAFYTSAFYAEPLFLFLLAGFFWHFCHSGRRVYLLYFALLPLARGSAVFVFGGLMLYALLDYARHKEMRIAAAHAPPAAGADWRPYAQCAIAFAAGACAYLVFFTLATGDAFSGFTAQARYPTHNKISNLFDLRHVWETAVGAHYNTRWFHSDYSRLDYWVMWPLLAAIALFARAREWGLLCFYLPLFYAHASMGPLTSFSRYVLTALPFLALLVAKQTRRNWQAALVCALCAAAFVAQLGLAARFSVNIWVN